MKAIFFEAMAGKLPELVEVPEKEGRLDYAWMEEKIGYGCDCLDSTLRCIGEKTYRIWVDDSGVKRARLTAYGSETCWLFGNMFIFGKEDLHGELTEVTEHDLEHIKARVRPWFDIVMLFDLSHPKTAWDFEALALMALQEAKYEEK